MDNFGMQPPMPVKKTLGPPAQLYLPPKDHKKKTLIIVLCVCVAVLAIVLLGWLRHINSPAYRVQRGLFNLAREAEEMKNPLMEKAGVGAVRQMMAKEGYSADSKLNVTVETGDYYLGEITLGVDTECDKDMTRKEMAASTTLSMMNYEFGHVEVYGDDENFCFSVPELLLEDMYIENEYVLSQYNDSFFGQMFGEVEEDGVLVERGTRLDYDYSIDLFNDQWIFADEDGIVSAFLEKYASEVEECRRHMTIEKAGTDLYRVSFDPLYFNELVREVLYDYLSYNMAGREQVLGMVSDFDIIANEDISFLFAINRENRIESIRIEEPLSLCQGDLQISGDVYFLGTERSVDKMQGKIEVKNEREEETKEEELTWQVIQSLEADEYRAESNVRYSIAQNGEKQNLGLDIDLLCDGRKDSFETDISLMTPFGEADLTAEGGLSHIQKGESFNLELDEVVLSMDDEELLLIRGEVGVEPLSRRVKQNVKPKTAFFDLTEDDWYDWFGDVIDEYDYLLEGLFW